MIPLKEALEAFDQFWQKIGKGICPHCDKPMTMEEVTPCIYATPCGHRLYEGTLAEDGEGKVHG